ncbi:MAG TPA: thiamine phosphate synthase [Syntrophobacter fumaroxidans]|nr:thiamine phosphate synthase [Syntrophobacter fumaroxidans]
MKTTIKAARTALLLDADVYPVTCAKLSNGRTDLEVLDAVIEGGARMIQLREKDLSKRDLYHLALKFREVTARARVLFIINDHLDIALAAEADGVHLGQDDLPLAAARRLAPDLILGASTHSLEEALRAKHDGADYVNIGPIFPTKTKVGVDRLLGPEAIAAISPHLDIPFTVMGGINASNIDRVLENGARRIAMVSAITMAPDIAETVRAFREKIGSYSRPT